MELRLPLPYPHIEGKTEASCVGQAIAFLLFISLSTFLQGTDFETTGLL